MRTPYSQPDDQRVRLVRSEMESVQMLLAMLSTAEYSKDDLKAPLSRVKHGNRLFRMSCGLMHSVINKMTNTISTPQCKQIYGTMKDYEVRLLPKLTPGSTCIVITKEQAKHLLDNARWKCHDCVEDSESCRKCETYKLLESITPLDDYGDGMICPYSLAEWRD